MMMFVGPVEVSGIIGKTVRMKRDGGVGIDIVQRDATGVVIGVLHLHKDEVERIVRMYTMPRRVNNPEHRRM